MPIPGARFRHQLGSKQLRTPEEFWIEADVDGDWMVAYRVLQQEGRPVIGEVRIFPAEKPTTENPVGRATSGEWSGSRSGLAATVPRGGISTRLLRAVRLGSDFAEGLKAGNRYLKLIPEVRSRFRAAGFCRLKKHREGTGWDVEHLLRAAVFYVERGGRRPTADLAEAWGIKPSQARDLLQAAKKKGFLTSGTRGKTSRVLTDTAKALLRKESEK